MSRSYECGSCVISNRVTIESDGVRANCDACNNTIIVEEESPAAVMSGGHTFSNTITAHQRKPRDQQEFCTLYEYQQPTKPSLRERLNEACTCSGSRLLKIAQRRLPILAWLPAYNFRRDVLADIVAGITLAIVQIPQAMAFTMLSSASPVYGLYATFFSTALYFFLGTSKFSSLGMAGVTALVVGEAINARLDRLNAADEADFNSSFAFNSSDINVDQVKLEVATTMSFIVGIFQVVMGLLNLGCLSIFFSDVMMRACTMAAVLQMIIGQIPLMLGITAHRPKGQLGTVYNFIEICKKIPSTNIATLVVSLICIAFLLLVNEGINARYKHKMKIPIPTEIILILAGTGFSYYLNLHGNYGVKILSSIPTGLPKPTPPQINLIPELMGHSVVVTILTFTIIMSQAKVLSSKYDCFPDISQELFANGVSNILGSFFSSMPCSFAFVRCVLLIQLKAKSMLCSLVCALTLLLVLLFIAPVFEPLPHSVLAGILVVALAEILLDLKMIKTTWKSVKTDSILIVGSFIAVFLLDLQMGIAVGVIISMIMVLFQTIKIKITTLGNVTGTDLYLSPKKYKKAVELDNIKIFNIGGPLFFGTKETLKRKVDKKVVRPLAELKASSDTASNTSSVKIQCSASNLVPNEILSHRTKVEGIVEKSPPSTVVILDFSSVTFLDTSALRTLSMIKDELDKVDAIIYIASLREKVLKTIEASEFSSKLSNKYPTVHDAVQSARLLWAPLKDLTDITAHGYDNHAFVQHL